MSRCVVVSTVVCAQQVRMPPNSEQSCVGVQDQLIQLISSADCKCDVWMTKSGTTAAQACLFRKLWRHGPRQLLTHAFADTPHTFQLLIAIES